MYYNTQTCYDDRIDSILHFLFDYSSTATKQLQYQKVIFDFQQLDLPALYLLFSLVQQHLPRKAKVLFMAEDYQGKQEMLLEVMAHLVKQ